LKHYYHPKQYYHPKHYYDKTSSIITTTTTTTTTSRTMSDAQPYALEGAMEGEVDKAWDPNDESGIASF